MLRDAGLVKYSLRLEDSSHASAGVKLSLLAERLEALAIEDAAARGQPDASHKAALWYDRAGTAGQPRRLPIRRLVPPDRAREALGRRGPRQLQTRPSVPNPTL